MMLLEKHVWKSHIQVDTKVRLYQAFKPMSSRCWCMLPKREQSQRLVLGDWMPFFDTWSLRRILRIPYIRHVTNASVRKTSSCRPVSSIFKTRRLCFFGHMACSDSRQDHHRAISASLRPPRDWRRPRGRPHTTWLRGINNNNNTNICNVRSVSKHTESEAQAVAR